MNTHDVSSASCEYIQPSSTHTYIHLWNMLNVLYHATKTWPLWPVHLATSLTCRDVSNQKEDESNCGGGGAGHGETWWAAGDEERRVCEKKDANNAQISSNSEPERVQKRFLLLHNSSLLVPLCPTLALLLSYPSLLDLVAPSFPMQTWDAEQKAQYLGRGGRDVLGRGLRPQLSHRLTEFSHPNFY